MTARGRKKSPGRSPGRPPGCRGRTVPHPPSDRHPPSPPPPRTAWACGTASSRPAWATVIVGVPTRPVGRGVAGGKDYLLLLQVHLGVVRLVHRFSRSPESPGPCERPGRTRGPGSTLGVRWTIGAGGGNPRPDTGASPLARTWRAAPGSGRRAGEVDVHGRIPAFAVSAGSSGASRWPPVIQAYPRRVPRCSTAWPTSAGGWRHAAGRRRVPRRLRGRVGDGPRAAFLTLLHCFDRITDVDLTADGTAGGAGAMGGVRQPRGARAGAGPQQRREVAEATGTRLSRVR